MHCNEGETLKPKMSTQYCSVLWNTQRWIILGAATKGTCSKMLRMMGATVAPSKPKEVS